MPFSIGQYSIDAPALLAPMAGITDLPFRQAARDWGAGLTYSEMLTSETRLWSSAKSRSRLPQAADPLPRPVQIAGYDAHMLAEAAKACEDLGAGIIDINMGCPAKKVCRRAAGSSLLQDENLVEEILTKVVDAVSVPVTLKTRTGWSPEHKNGLRVAKIAEQAGIQALTMHGRTRACKFGGHAEYDLIAEITDAVNIPVIANGDIDSPEKAKEVLDYTGAAAVMVARAALGQPWIFEQIIHHLRGKPYSTPNSKKIFDTSINHLLGLHNLYGATQGVRIARKHIGWYLENMDLADLKKSFNGLQEAEEQLTFLHQLPHSEEIQQLKAA